MTMDWTLRARGGSMPEYGTDYEYFSIYMHQIKKTASNEFEQSATGYIDYCSSDKISFLEIKSMAAEVEIEAVDVKFFWLRPGKMLSDGLTSLESDSDAFEMSLSVDDSRIMHVFIRDSIEEYEGVEVQNRADFEVLTYGTKKNNDEDDDDGEDDFIDSDYDLHDNEHDGFDSFSADEIEKAMHKGNTYADGDVVFDDTRDDDSDVLLSCSETDEDDIVASRRHKPRYAEFTEHANTMIPRLEIGMKFQNFEQFKRAAKENAIRERVEIKFFPNDKERCKAYCKRTGCPFYIWASLMSSDKKTVQIKSGILEHDCSKTHQSRHVNADWIANNYLDNLRADPLWSINGIVQAVKKNEKVDISRSVAWRAKNIAMKIIDGDEMQQIASLHNYRLEILRSNPGSTVKFKLDNGVYQGIYICLAALKAGFREGCRRLISVDGCFLKGRYGGQLLTAVGIDANDCIYPIAYAAVQRENKENWMWFLEILAEDLDIDERNPCTFMSDRQKGLLPAVEQLFPYSEHRFCVRHILTNFRKRFPGKHLKDLLWSSARASHVDAFMKEMDKLAKTNKEAYQYLKNIPPHHWTRSHFSTQIRCDMLLNNLCESFNSSILEARTKGLITMCEMIRTKLMKRIPANRDAMKKCQAMYCPKILKKLEKNKQLSWSYRTEWSGGEKYQVSRYDGQFVVDRQCKTCSCRRWDLTGIPCCHAIAALYYNNDNPIDYIDDCYKVSTYLKTYSHLINPTNGKDMWPVSKMPPIIPNEPPKSKKGRRQTMRRKELDEGPSGTKSGIFNGKVSKKGIVMHCTVCGSTEHNKRFHGKQGNDATHSAQKILTVRRNKNHGQGGSSHSVFTPHTVEGNNAHHLQKRMTVKKNKNHGQSDGSHSISMPHTVQWMPDGTTKYPNTSSANASMSSSRSRLINNAQEEQVQNVNVGIINLQNSGVKKRKIWVPPGANYTSFGEGNW